MTRHNDTFAMTDIQTKKNSKGCVWGGGGNFALLMQLKVINMCSLRIGPVNVTSVKHHSKT